MTRSFLPRLPSRVSLSLLAAVTGASLAYLLIAWGILPAAAHRLSTFESAVGLLSIAMLAGGWISVFARRPEWRRTSDDSENAGAVEGAQV